VGGVCPATHDPANNECDSSQQCLDIGYCFAGETKVLTPGGYTKIKDLQVGDEVIAYDEIYNLNVIATVIKQRQNLNHDYYLINNTIKVTPEHFFAVINDGRIVWTKVKQLKVGDKLKNESGEKVVVESIDKLFSSEGFEVYNPTLTWPNTYYVLIGNKPVLVHNLKGL
jgi:intein/homing endonuclease